MKHILCVFLFNFCRIIKKKNILILCFHQVIKTLDKINENFQFVFDDTNEQNLLNKQKNRNTSLADIKEWFLAIKRITKESQDYYK